MKNLPERKYWLAPSLDSSTVLSITNEAEEEEEGRFTGCACLLPMQPQLDSINSCSPIFTAGNKQVLAV